MNALNEALEAATASPFFGLSLSMICFWIGKMMNIRRPSLLTNPYIIAVILVIAFLKITGASLENYQIGGDLLTMMLIPATAILGTTIYSRRSFIAKNFVPIIVGAVVGSATSMSSIWLMARAFGIDKTMMLSLLPKSVTTPIAMELAGISSGVPAIAIIAVAVTGVSGVVLGPVILKLIPVRDPISVGAAFGVASHVIGTTKAVEIGETEAAASSVEICCAGVVTVAAYMLFIV